MRLEALKAGVGFDPDFTMYADDFDLAIRIRNRGWKFVYDPSIRARHRTPDEVRDRRMRRTFAARNETWMALKYYPVHRVPVIVLRVLYWQMLAGRPESTARYAVAGVASGCWRWRVAVGKREAIHPDVLHAFERISGVGSMRPMSPRLRSMITRRLRALARSATARMRS
jgi:GT2 family glycosyltransferase